MKFLIKLNATGCPGGIAAPTSPEEWRDGWFALGRAAFKKRFSTPSVGDEVLVWTNEKPRTGERGRGLVGRGLIAAVRLREGEVHLKNIVLYPDPSCYDLLLWNVAEPRRHDRSDILVDVHRHRTTRLFPLGEEDVQLLENPR